MHFLRRIKKRYYPLILLPVLLLVLWVVQVYLCHLTPPFSPDYPLEDLTVLLSQESLSQADYDTLFLQTGLSAVAVDKLLSEDGGRDQILETQTGFFASVQVECRDLFYYFVKEDFLLSPEDGSSIQSPQFADLQDGDILLTFSTHSVGWRHGHAALVVDAEAGYTLEAAVIGSYALPMWAERWRSYSTCMVLRLKDITPELQEELVAWALEKVQGMPYDLLCGLVGDKAPDADTEGVGVHCSYLVWYVFQQFGYDLDSDGGRVVTVADLAESPLLEVVQVYGLDPRDLPVYSDT